MTSSPLWSLTLIAFVAVPYSFVNADIPKAETQIGSISGQQRTVEGVQVDEFEGIRYAKPPVGELRFALPVPSGPLGNLNATSLPAKCPQPEFALGLSAIPEAEDCLYLNVYRKSGTKNGDNKPVAVILHGGAFSAGSAFDVASSPLSGLGDVVAVVPNYRLGILGFGDMKDIAPGNLGLHDQRLALEWVQDNIAAFGGNPDKVTLIGVSAGAWSVSAHIISPLSREGRKLFHAAILDGGTLGPDLVVSSDSSLDRMKSIAGKVGCKTESTEMLECLRKADAKDLVDYSLNGPILTFLPTADGKFLSADIAEDGRPKEFVKVKTLIGYAKDEGTLLAGYSFNLTHDTFPNLTSENEFVDWCAKLATGYKYKLNLNDSDTRKRVSDNYYQKHSNRFLDAAAFVGDGTFACPINAFIKSYSTSNPNVYAYRFDRKFAQPYLFLDPNRLGAFHSSGFLHMTGFVFRMQTFLPNITVNADDKTYSLDAIQLVANFMKLDEQAPEFRGVKLPAFGKAEGVMVFDDKSKVATSLCCEERCKNVFSSH